MGMEAETARKVRPLAARARRDAIFFAVAAAVFLLDQATKRAVERWLALGESFPESWPVRLTHVTNTGAAFGILEGQTGFLIVTTVVGLGAILLYYWFPPAEHALLRVALGLQLGGAMGNLVDRVRSGYVVDFVDLQVWPKFNVADSSIVIGVALLLWFFFLHERTAPARPD